MASWTDLSAAFGYGTTLTSSQMQQLRDNITALAEGASGHPEIVPAALKVATQSDSHTGSTALQELSLTGGQYCFLPQTYVSNAVCEVNLYLEYTGKSHTSYLTYAAYKINTGTAYTAYFRNTYLTSSGPIFWAFALFDKIKEKITRWNIAPDHPCYGYGNPDIVKHPFVKYDKNKYQLLVANPDNQQLKEFETLAIKAGKSLHDFIMDCCTMDLSRSAQWPDVPVTVGSELPKKVIPKLHDALTVPLIVKG